MSMTRGRLGCNAADEIAALDCFAQKHATLRPTGARNDVLCNASFRVSDDSRHCDSP